MMKAPYLALIAASLLSTSALAAGGYTGPASTATQATTGQTSTAQGAYTGPGAAAVITTVADALKAADDTHVILQGTITQRIRKDKYEFSDVTGKIQVEIDDEDWPPQVNISEKTLVKLSGEVDRGWRGVEVDVDFVEIIHQP